MGISSIGAMDSMSAMRPSAKSMDAVSKSIQNEISDAQRQKQEISSKEELSVREKQKKSQELQQEISNLNTQLRQREKEVQKEEKKDAVSVDKARPDMGDEKDVERKDMNEPKAENQEEQVRKLENIDIQAKEEKPDVEAADVEDSDTMMSPKETKAVVAGDIGIDQVVQQRRVITRMKDAIAVLKGEIRQDEARGLDVEDKKAELQKQEDKMQKASASQFSVLGDANKAMRAAQQEKVDELQGRARTAADTNRENEERAVIQATNFVKQSSDAQQFFIR